MKISDYRPPRSAIKPTIACQPLRTRLVNIFSFKRCRRLWRRMKRTFKINEISIFSWVGCKFYRMSGIYISIGKFLISDTAHLHESSSLNKDKIKSSITRLKPCESSQDQGNERLKSINVENKKSTVHKTIANHKWKKLSMVYVPLALGACRRHALACNIDMGRVELDLFWRNLRSMLRCFWHSVDRLRRRRPSGRLLLASVALVRRPLAFGGRGSKFEWVVGCIKS